MAAPGGLERFNALDPGKATAALRSCNGSTVWISTVAAGRPYPSVAALLSASDECCRRLGPGDVDEALSDHPRIGERTPGDGEAARLSRHEQASVSDAGDDLRGAIAEGNRAYEERFGRVFLIRAAGRSPAEMLSEVHRRLANDESSERAEVVGQLAEITRLRVQGLVRS